MLSRVNVPTDCMHAIANHGMLILGPAPSQVLNLKDPGEIEFPQLKQSGLHVVPGSFNVANESN